MVSGLLTMTATAFASSTTIMLTNNTDMNLKPITYIKDDTLFKNQRKLTDNHIVELADVLSATGDKRERLISGHVIDFSVTDDTVTL